MLNYNITLEWNPPEGSGLEVIVDSYNINVIPKPVSHPINNLVYSTSWNVTLQYNANYTVSINAENCAGESSEVTLPVLYGK